MVHQIYRLCLLSLLGPLLSVLVLNLLLTHFCRGHSQLIGPPQSILAGIGDDIILPCHLKPAMDVNAETIEWTRPDLGQRFVHVRRSGQDLVNIKNPSYKGRTSLFPDELKQGNISLKLSKVQLSDQGTYVCDIPLMNKKSSVRLVVALHTSSVPVISLSGIDRNKGEVILNCDSNSWYPEPEVFWLDGEGNLLSAGSTETVRGPDDLYTVSSRVTVEKRHSNSFTCRVQQNHINQTRETLIFISEDFFEVLSSSSSTTVVLAVTLAVCILVILILGLYVRRQKKSTEKKQKGEVLTKEEEKPMKMKKKDEMKMIKKERQDKEKAQSKVRMLKDQLESKIKEVEHEKDKVKILTEEKKRSEEKQQKLQTNIKQLEEKLQDEKKKSEEAQRELNDQWEKKLQEERSEREKTLETFKNEHKTEDQQQE